MQLHSAEMAPVFTDVASWVKRDVCYDGYYNRTYSCYRSRWDSWGRWVALVVIIVAVLILAFIFSCINARRRRRRGMAPMYGTGWIPAGVPKNNYQNNGGYYNNQPYNGAPAPPYSGPSNGAPIPNQQTGTTFNSNDGYYGQNNGGYGQGVEMQPPQNAYHGQRGGEPVYEAPLGAPPTKGDGIVR